MKGKRHQIVELSPEAILRVISAFTGDIPDDATVVAAFVDPFTDGICIKVASESFPEVPPRNVAPNMSLRLTL